MFKELMHVLKAKEQSLQHSNSGMTTLFVMLDVEKFDGPSPQRIASPKSAPFEAGMERWRKTAHIYNEVHITTRALVGVALFDTTTS